MLEKRSGALAFGSSENLKVLRPFGISFVLEAEITLDPFRQTRLPSTTPPLRPMRQTLLRQLSIALLRHRRLNVKRSRAPTHGTFRRNERAARSFELTEFLLAVPRPSPGFVANRCDGRWQHLSIERFSLSLWFLFFFRGPRKKRPFVVETLLRPLPLVTRYHHAPCHRR